MANRENCEEVTGTSSDGEAPNAPAVAVPPGSDKISEVADTDTTSPEESEATDPAVPEALVAGKAETATSDPAPFRKRPIFLDFDLLQLAGIFFLLDQLTKFLVRAYLPFGHSYPSTGFFRFTHAENTGSAFGILQGNNTPLIFVSFVGIFVLAMIYQSQPRVTNLLRLSLAFQIGGAVGNLLDRFRLGAVTDFIDVGIWPIFNLADASIITGLVLLGWILLASGKKEVVTTSESLASRNYQLKRRGRCARCGRYHAGRRSGCHGAAHFPAGRRYLNRRIYRRQG